MVKIDANQEAIALIRMAIDNNNKAHVSQGQTDIKVHETDSEPFSLKQHWTFGSRSGTQLDSRVLEKQLAPDDDFTSFDERLRSFIAHSFPEEALRYEDLVYVRSVTQKLAFHGSIKVLTGSAFQMCHNPISIHGGLDGVSRYFALQPRFPST